MRQRHGAAAADKACCGCLMKQHQCMPETCCCSSPSAAVRRLEEQCCLEGCDHFYGSTAHGRHIICSDTSVSSLIALMSHNSSTARPVQGKRLCEAPTCHRHARQRCPPRPSSQLQANQGLDTHNFSQQTSLCLLRSWQRVSTSGSCTPACWLFRGNCYGFNNGSSLQNVVQQLVRAEDLPSY